MKIEYNPDYAAARARAYPPLTDFADALVKQALGDPKPFLDYVAKCKAVKDRIPKPPGQ